MDVSRAAALTDERMAAFRAEVDAPAVAYGLVKDGELVHASGVGALADGRVPGPDDVFRIASMTKSFTASAVLLLRDRGRLRLDDELVGPPPVDRRPHRLRRRSRRPDRRPAVDERRFPDRRSVG